MARFDRFGFVVAGCFEIGKLVLGVVLFKKSLTFGVEGFWAAADEKKGGGKQNGKGKTGDHWGAFLVGLVDAAFIWNVHFVCFLSAL